jgi:hypothetical protein
MIINTVEKIYGDGKLQCYKVTYVNSNILRSVPLVEDNTDYQEIQEWIAEGNEVIDNGA